MKFLKTLVFVVEPAVTGLVMVSVAIMPPGSSADTMLTTGVERGKARTAAGQFAKPLTTKATKVHEVNA
jgi:hypothetical protein